MMKNDKYYTKLSIAKRCIDFTKEHIPNFNDYILLEPSAGNGSFSSQLQNCEAYDLYPESQTIKKLNFLNYLPDLNKKYIVIGNPPFGKRSDDAVLFFNKSATFADYIAMIFPVSFMKWSVQKQLNAAYNLVDYFYLPENSFLENNKEYKIRTVFQIWSKEELCSINKRLSSPPKISHKDFLIWQYNATSQSFNSVYEDWNLAVFRQGWHDYNQLFYPKDKNEIIKRMRDGQQFFFIKFLNQEAEEVILKMDFNSLAARNTTIPGFGKGDFVSYYEELKK